MTARVAPIRVIGDEEEEGVAVFASMARIQDPRGLRERKDVTQKRPLSRRQRTEWDKGGGRTAAVRAMALEAGEACIISAKTQIVATG